MCRLLHYCISRQWSIQEHDECDRNVRIENREANIRVSPTDQSSATVPLGGLDSKFIEGGCSDLIFDWLHKIFFCACILSAVEKHNLPLT